MDHPDRQESSPAENPYGRPESALQPVPVHASRAARIAHRVIAILIATFCALQYGGSGRIDDISLALILGFTAYAAWRWKQGALTGWPHAEAQVAAEEAGT